MFESTPLLIYTLFYIIVSACFVFKTTEFVSNGITIENLFETFIDKEHNNFIMHHIKRSTYTIVVHSCLPLVYLLGTLLINDDEKAFVSVYFYHLLCMFLVPVIYSCFKAFKWKSNNWAKHPTSIILSRYDSVNWTRVARNISTEYQHIGKLMLNCGPLNRTVVTANWIISIKQYSISVAKKSESSFLVYSSDDHNAVLDGTPGSIQFINIQVIPIRSRIKWFFVRIRSEDFESLEEKIGQPIQIANNVRLQRTRTERFIEVFRDQVSQNPIYSGYNVLEVENSLCAGCLVNPPDIKLNKCCENNVNGYPNCSQCQCRPMWCVDCMAKWYESRQSHDDTTNWLSSKCTCPLCRQVFCILDVCPLENSELAKIK